MLRKEQLEEKKDWKFQWILITYGLAAVIES